MRVEPRIAEEQQGNRHQQANVHADRRERQQLLGDAIDEARLGKSRNQFIEELGARKIGSSVHFIPVHRQPYYRARYGEVVLPGADRFYRQTLSLPLYPGLSDADVARVAAALGEVVKG